MGVPERRPRDKERVRRKIIDAAAAQFIVANGYKAFPLRQVADEIEFSACSIYL